MGLKSLFFNYSFTKFFCLRRNEVLPTAVEPFSPSSCESHRALCIVCIWNNKFSYWRRCLLWQVFRIFATYKWIGKFSSRSLSCHRIQLSSFSRVFKSLIISKMCKRCLATDFRLISWPHTAHSSGAVPSRIIILGCNSAFLQCQLVKKSMLVCVYTHTVCASCCRKKEYSPYLGVFVGSSGGSSSPPASLHFVRAWPNNNNNKKGYVQICLRHDWLLWFTLGVFVVFPHPTPAAFSCCSCQLVLVSVLAQRGCKVILSVSLPYGV